MDNEGSPGGEEKPTKKVTKKKPSSKDTGDSTPTKKPKKKATGDAGIISLLFWISTYIALDNIIHNIIEKEFAFDIVIGKINDSLLFSPIIIIIRRKEEENKEEIIN